MNTYIQLIDKYKNDKSRAFIFGAGPSLWYNMQDSFFKEIPKYGITVAVNSAIMAYKEPNFFISCDHLATRWSWWPDVLNSKCIKIVRSSWEKYKNDIKGFYIFEPRKTPENEIDIKDTGLCYPSSLSSAIDFVIKLEIKRIFVLGLDHSTIEGKHHFWQFLSKQPRQIRPAQGPFSQQKKVFPIHLESYKALEKFAIYKNCKIFNCNPESKVEVFEKIKFTDILKIIKE